MNRSAAGRIAVSLAAALVLYLAATSALAIVVLVQGLPRGLESQATASAEAQLFDIAAGIGLIVTAVLLVAAGILMSDYSEDSPRRLRSLAGGLIGIAVVLALFVFGVAGAMGWHDFGFAG